MRDRRKKQPKTVASRTQLRASLRNGGFRLLDSLDHRTLLARRWRHHRSGLITHLGGEKQISHVESVRVDRAAVKALLCDWYEAEFQDCMLNGRDIDPAKVAIWLQIDNSRRRDDKVFGFKRRMKDVTRRDFQNLVNGSRSDDVEDAEVVEGDEAAMESDR